jgi:integrase
MLNKVLMVDFAQLTIKELSVARLRAYFMGKSGLGKSASTIENYKKALRPVLDQAVEDKILLVNPLNSVPAFVKNFRVNPPKYTPTNKEVLKLFFSENHWGKGAIDPYFRMAFVGANTGARIGELQALQRKHIKFNPEAQVMKLLIEQSMKEGTKTIGPTKTKRKRWVPLVGLAVSLVLLDLGNDPEEFVFKSKGKPLRQRMTNIRLKQAYDELIEVSHPAMFSFHSLRHWFDTRMLILTTQNRLLVRMLMGHYDSKDQTQEYKDEGTEEEFDGSIPYLRELFNFGEEPESKYKVLPTLYLQ